MSQPELNETMDLDEQIVRGSRIYAAYHESALRRNQEDFVRKDAEQMTKAAGIERAPSVFDAE